MIIKEETEKAVIVERAANKRNAGDVVEIEDDDQVMHSGGTNDIDNDKPSAKEVITYPNNPDTEGDHHWWLNGQNKVRKEENNKRGKVLKNNNKEGGADEEVFKKMYYVCAEGKKKNKTNWCKASKTVHALPNGNMVTFKGVHNHPPSDKPKTDPEVEKMVKAQLRVGAKVSVIHSRLVNDAEGLITQKTVPNTQRMNNWKHQMAMLQLPTGK